MIPVFCYLPPYGKFYKIIRKINSFSVFNKKNNDYPNSVIHPSFRECWILMPHKMHGET